MKITVSFFAITREITGEDHVELEVESDNTIQQLWDILGRKYAGLEKHLAESAAAVNNRYAKMNTVLRQGDNISVIPPVCGG